MSKEFGLLMIARRKKRSIKRENHIRYFRIFCKEEGITQNISKVGCPYDNASMERYYNILKNVLTNLYPYHI